MELSVRSFFLYFVCLRKLNYIKNKTENHSVDGIRQQIKWFNNNCCHNNVSFELKIRENKNYIKKSY